MKATNHPSSASQLPSSDPIGVARAAGLHYSSDDKPGIGRRRTGRGWRYFAPDGAPVTDANELARIRAIAIPPAWHNVWINPSRRGHLQATGRDDRGRKQYRYHPIWRVTRDETKFSRLIAFGQALPLLRARVASDLGLPGLSREKILATVVRLLDESLIRIGNAEYERQNGSYGLTTLHDDHVAVAGDTVHFVFKGKGGKQHRIDVRDRRVARIIRRLHELPGQHLFQYLDDYGETQTIGSEDVNAYLHEIAGEAFTAKDFRTWAGTVLAACCLCKHEPGEAAAREAHVIATIDAVADRLGNTRAVCRASYIHPAILAGYADGSLCQRRAASHGDPGPDEDERWVLTFLRGSARRPDSN